MFLSMFILEGIGPDFGWMDSLMHGLVALVAFIATVVAWKWPKIGGWIFVLAGIKFLLPSFWNAKSWLDWALSSIPICIGILFLLEGWSRRK